MGEREVVSRYRAEEGRERNPDCSTSIGLYTSCRKFKSIQAVNPRRLPMTASQPQGQKMIRLGQYLDSISYNSHKTSLIYTCQLRSSSRSFARLIPSLRPSCTLLSQYEHCIASTWCQKASSSVRLVAWSVVKWTYGRALSHPGPPGKTWWPRRWLAHRHYRSRTRRLHG